MIIELTTTALTGLVGMAAGAHAATWGMYKDSIYEGFSWGKYARSILIGMVLALGCQLLIGFDVRDASQVLLLFGVVYVLERMIVELWKLFIREEDQAKYTIPMRFAMRGTPVYHHGGRWAAGLIYVIAIVVGIAWLATLHKAELPLSHIINATLLGAFGGSFTSVGGAWKDAPSEGFRPIKFLRSLLLSAIFAALLSPFSDSYMIIVLAALGYERATAETYKTFFFSHRPVGKFAGKPVAFPEMILWRRRFVPLYVVIWFCIAAGFVSAFV